MRPLIPLFLVACLSACGVIGFPGVYKIDVEQGNIVTQDQVAQLKPGMSRRQVQFILGTPLLQDPFDQSRWDYPYSKRNGTKTLDESRFTVYFDGDTLVSYEGNVETSWDSRQDVEVEEGTPPPQESDS
ncbi:MAG: outer membrane protein assembly factor BamE [Pseudomonadales bacterium]|nr:outer membrane protein assembly factor BamE [Halieaceae bacterium]MCP5164789.1 outer membrane protein assembly factor BamE [Pseudomonadales bacterium]MCP5191208.1 outer membrane protein assembly factor BamE [Pseudomonadales bacterium]MCP5203990.1 outer membrane protein assembly factor BamE [Pseudomonadales bacterium]